LSKSSSALIRDSSTKNKKPAELYASAGQNLKIAVYEFAISGEHLRRRAVRVMMMAVMDVRQHWKKTKRPNPMRQPGSTGKLAVFSMEFIEFSYGSRDGASQLAMTPACRD
jgi:hypothetical protein